MVLGRNVWPPGFKKICVNSAQLAAEELLTFSSQEVSEDISEGFSFNLRTLLHPHLPRGLSTMGLADLSTFGSCVGVAAVCEGSGQPFLS